MSTLWDYADPPPLLSPLSPVPSLRPAVPLRPHPCPPFGLHCAYPYFYTAAIELPKKRKRTRKRIRLSSPSPLSLWYHYHHPLSFFLCVSGAAIYVAFSHKPAEEKKDESGGGGEGRKEERDFFFPHPPLLPLLQYSAVCIPAPPHQQYKCLCCFFPRAP